MNSAWSLLCEKNNENHHTLFIHGIIPAVVFFVPDLGIKGTTAGNLNTRPWYITIFSPEILPRILWFDLLHTIFCQRNHG